MRERIWPNGMREYLPDPTAPKPYVIYHHPCSDGFGAAYAAWRFFGDHARYIGLNYDEEIPKLREGTIVFMLDFSFKRPLMLELARWHPRIVVLDHHISAAKELEGISDLAPNIEVVFANEHSGAWIAWNYFHPGAEMPWLIPYIEDRDLWRHRLPNTRAVNMALATYPMTFEVWHDLMSSAMGDPAKSYDRLVAEGTAILRYYDSRVEGLLKNARVAKVGDYYFPAVNAPHFLASDLGNRLLDQYPTAPFSGVYRDEKDGTRSWSFRSRDDRVNVQELASSLGGGGHRNASGASELHAEEKITFVPTSYDKWLQYHEPVGST